MSNRPIKTLSQLAAGIATGYLATQFAWVFWRLAKADPRFTTLVPQNRAPRGISSVQGKTKENVTIQYTIENGIEQISYIPKERKFETPLLLLHGMFHGAWCWRRWQELFSEWGWESHAFSLPGHSGSPEQRQIRLCTLDYYLGFLKDEAKKLPRKPVIIGHSMGGAITQWYLKYINQPAAAVFVASWDSHSILAAGAIDMIKRDPSLIWRMSLSWDSSPWIRNPQRVAEMFINPKARISPEELHNHLVPESALILFQHNPPFWQPPESVKSPSLWLAGGEDMIVRVAGVRKSALHYGGDFTFIPGAGHDIMLEYNYRQSAEIIHNWLVAQKIQ
jgi:pimeloyl-ACP methyl ester carboxylesterase